MATVDVTVRGAGVFGLSVAWACLKRGARVRVVDPGGPGAGASGGVVGALSPAAPDGPWSALKAFQVEALAGAAAFWAEVDAASGQASGHARIGRVIPLRDAEAVRRAEAQAEAAAQRWGAGYSFRVTDGPGDGWVPEGPRVEESFSGRVSPRRATASLAEAVRRRGAAIEAEAPDEGAVVWATGWRGLEALGAALGRPAGRGVKGQAAVLALDVAERPQIQGPSLYIVPHANGTVGVGSTAERHWEDEAEVDEGVKDVLARARALVPALADAPVLERWAGVRPRAVGHGPLLGPWPGRPGHWIANGGFKIGIGLGPLAGERIAAALLEGAELIEEFLPERRLG